MRKQFVQTLLGVAMLAMCAALVAMPAMADSVAYVQTSDNNSAYASQNDTSGGGLGNFATAYDNFQVSLNDQFTELDWVGSFFGAPGTGNITAFTINFYADNAGTPGAQLSSTSVTNFSQAAMGVDNIGDPLFAYSTAINFNAAAGTQYWLSIVPDQAFPPQWGWETGVGGDGAAYQCFLGSCGPVGNDLAFTLTAVPEPSSLLLLAGSLPALALRLRRKRQ